MHCNTRCSASFQLPSLPDHGQRRMKLSETNSPFPGFLEASQPSNLHFCFWISNASKFNLVSVMQRFVKQDQELWLSSRFADAALPDRADLPIRRWISTIGSQDRGTPSNRMRAGPKVRNANHMTPYLFAYDVLIHCQVFATAADELPGHPSKISP